MASGFVHLHAHSEYSLLDGSIKVESLVKRAQECGMPAVALTDHGNMFGMVHFYRAARRHGVKPILGIEAYITRGSRHDRSRRRGEMAQIDHLILLARNLTGYHNLLKLSSIAYLEGFYYKPRIDFEVLAEHAEGLIGTTACLRGTVAQKALHEGYEAARATALQYQDILGKGNYYIEMQDHGIEQQKQLNPMYRRLSEETNIPLIVSNDVHYLKREDAEAHEVLLCLQTGSDFDDPRRFRFTTQELYFKTEEEMRELFPDCPEALDNTVAIAERCNVELEEGNFYLPQFPLPEGFETNTDYLRHLANEGVRKRFPEITDTIRERLEYELSVIESMDFPGYFLIVRDIVNHAREKGIPVGPGRGSAAGSLVTYAIGITDVDPMEHNLLFERMLNPERVSMPDIDIDFCFERRDEVIRYVIDRYSKDNVCQIITFGTMAARASVRDVGRVLKIPLAEVDRLAKLIPAVPGTSLQEALDTVPELSTLVKNNPDYQRLMKLSKTLEGVSRHASIHAAGMIITPTPLINHVPLYKSSRGEITSQYDMKAIDAIGLLKIDVLGLRTLTVIDKALRMIEINHGVHIDAADIPMKDDKTFDLLRTGRTVGVFQLESEGMRELLKNLQPTVFSDLIAVNALYRPGPLGSNMHVQFVDCKQGRKKIRYAHPLLEPILRDTYGVILYQEQVMQIASTLAGFSLGQADLLRKAMGKKNASVMDEQRRKFLEGADKNGIEARTAKDIWDQMAEFAKYGFNKSHSAAYAVVSMRTAYLKANYPAEFMAANLTSELDDTDRIVALLDDCREMGIDVVPPGINTCEPHFVARDGRIYYGLGAIKNVGAGAIEIIVEERGVGGSFRSFKDLVCRINSRLVNKRVYESLIAAGALDSLPGHRAQKMAALDAMMERSARKFRDAERGQIGLFSGETVELDDAPLPECNAWSTREQLQRERDAIGFYLTGHPLDSYRNVIRMVSSVTSRDIPGLVAGERVTLGGMVSARREIMDRNNRPMAFVTVEDADGHTELLVFADAYQAARDVLDVDKVVLVTGRVSRRNGGEGKVMVESVLPVKDDEFPRAREIHITVNLDSFVEEKVTELSHMLAGHDGDVRVFFHVYAEGRRVYVIRSKSEGIHLDYDLASSLVSSLGVENIRLVPRREGSAA